PPHARELFLDSVACTSTTHCVAVGAYKRFSYHTLVEVWDGSAWTIQPSADPPKRQGFLLSVTCSTKRACIAVGSRGTANPGGTLKGAWDGTPWRIQPSATPDSHQGVELLGVACTSPTACLAVGIYVGGAGFDFQALAETWNGVAWSLTTPPIP